MNTKHIPGPWRLMNSHKAGFLDVYTTHETGSSVDGVATDFICEIGPGARNEGEINSNANLIAAAPELLSALERMLLIGEYRDSESKERVDCLFPQRFNEARAAIAKAKGEA